MSAHDPHRERATDARPFFVIGSRHSGADHLQRLLDAHPEVALTHEAGVVDALCFCFEYCSLPAGRVSVDSGMKGVIQESAIPLFAPILLEHSKQMLEQFYARSFGKRFKRWGETTYEPGWAFAMQRVYPAVQYVVLVRDPRDTIAAHRSHGVRSGAAFDAWASAPVAESAAGWRERYDFIANADLDRLFVRYEDLAQDPAATCERVLKHLGLEMDGAVKDAARAEVTEATVTAGARSGVGRWKKELSAADAKAIEAVCAEGMKRFGYG